MFDKKFYIYNEIQNPLIESIFGNKDVRNIINSFLDLPSLQYILYTFGSPEYDIKIYNKKRYRRSYSMFCGEKIKQKMNQCYNSWYTRYHMPHRLLKISDMQIRTRNNINNISSKYGIKWKDQVMVWDYHDFSKYKNYKDKIIHGYHPEIGKLLYVRHDTSGGGSSFIGWKKNKKMKKISVRKALAKGIFNFWEEKK